MSGQYSDIWVIAWDDSATEDGWDEIEARAQSIDHLVESVGWIIFEDATTLAMIASRDLGGGCNQAIYIPISAVRARYRLALAMIQ